MTDKPLVSIIVPVYNTKPYLVKCLDSLVNQTYKSIEIICVNDGSTDNSKETLDYYDYMYSNVIVCHKNNGGLSSARNCGLDKANGKYITFVDSDDYLELDVIKKAVNTLEKTNCDLYVYGIQQFANEDTAVIRSTNKWFERKMQPAGLQKLTQTRELNTNVHVCNKVFRKDIVRDLRFIDKLLYEDIYFTWSYMFRCTSVFYEESVGYHYRVHENSIMSKTDKEQSLRKSLHHLYNWESLLNDAVSSNVVYKRYAILHRLLDVLTDRVKCCCHANQCSVVDAYYNMYRNELNKVNEKPKVSIVVPVYNVENYLEECLNSLVTQTLAPIEIICVDDGSTDDSGQILDDYAKKFPQITVYHKTNGGLSSARNYGLAKVRSDYVGFVDSDDYIAPDTFTNAYNAMIDHCPDFVVFGAKPVKDVLDVSQETAQTIEEFKDWLKCQYNGYQTFDFEKAKNTVQCVWNKLYKTELCKKISFGDKLLYEDISFVWTYYMHSKSAVYIEGDCYFYRIRLNSIMDKALKEQTYEKAIHHLKNVERIIDYMFYNECLFNKHIECMQFLIDRHTRRAKRMCNVKEHYRIDNESKRIQMKFQDIINLYGEN